MSWGLLDQRLEAVAIGLEGELTVSFVELVVGFLSVAGDGVGILLGVMERPVTGGVSRVIGRSLSFFLIAAHGVRCRLGAVRIASAIEVLNWL